MPALFLGVLLVAPLASVLRHAFDQPSGLDLGTTGGIAALAALQAAISTALALLIGLPIAGILATYRFRGRGLLQALATVPFVLPTVVIALAFRGLLGARIEPGLLLVILAHVYINLAVIVRIVGANWQQLDPRTALAARSLGASPLTAFRTITLPELKASITSAAAVVFVFCFSSLGVVLILGDSGTRTLESQILRQTSLLLDFPAAAVTALLQIAVVSAALLLGARASMTRTRFGAAARATPAPRPRSVRARVHVAVVATIALVILLLPLLSLASASLRSEHGWTLEWWRSVASIDAGTTRLGSPVEAIATSVRYALITGVIASVVGVLAAMSVLAHRLGRAIAVIALAPLGVSAATLGLGMMLTFGRPPLDLRATALLVPLAHSLVAVPLVIAVVLPSLRSGDARLVRAAASLGAAPTRAFLTAYGPILRVVMIAAGGLAACVSLGEFGAASFLARTDAPTVPVQIVRLLQRPGEASVGVASALAMLLVVGTLVLVSAVDALGRRR
ncbi:MAG: ABC transporter permease subunit [Candidatus Nanopelagicales bacterium]|nr:ABC transporter permease subunit [Candidatus Nanopelagicales bacterium]